MREKGSRGVCFKCDERWSYNHVCRNKEFRLILLEDEDEIDKEEIVEEESSRTDSEDPMTGLSLQSLIGFTNPKTMK